MFAFVCELLLKIQHRQRQAHHNDTRAPQQQTNNNTTTHQQTKQTKQLNDAASEEVLKVEQRYNEQRRPLYARRGDALSALPGFWKGALLGHEALHEFIADDDARALDALTRVRCDVM